MLTTYTPGKGVLVFNSKKRLVMIGESINQVSKFSSIPPGNISKVCSGKLQTLKGYFFRFTNDEVVVELSDIGKLKIEEYDYLCGEHRVIKKVIRKRKIKE